jgi:hypothetical protein
MKLLGWLKGRGWLMVGLVSAALAGPVGCDDAGKKKVNDPDLQEMYGVWMDTVDQDDTVAPVYGIWGDVEQDLRPGDMYGIWVDSKDTEKFDAAVYGIWDAGLEPDTQEEPEVMDMYGIFVDTVTPDAKADAEEPNPEVYGIWVEDIKE